MTEFQHVQWGDTVPVEYQRLTAMMNNDQYLKDIADVAPRGVLMWKRSTSDATLTVSGFSYQDFPGFVNLKFTCAASRMIKITFNAAYWTAVTIPNNILCRIYIDSIEQTYAAAGVASGFTYSAFPYTQHITEAVLSSGEHNLTIKYACATQPITVKQPTMLVVEDMGAYIAESP